VEIAHKYMDYLDDDEGEEKYVKLDERFLQGLIFEVSNATLFEQYGKDTRSPGESVY
jgi:hypothetical protein